MKQSTETTSVVLGGGRVGHFLMSVGPSGARWSAEFADAQLFTEQRAVDLARQFNGSAYADWGLETARLLPRAVRS